MEFGCYTRQGQQPVSGVKTISRDVIAFLRSRLTGIESEAVRGDFYAH